MPPKRKATVIATSENPSPDWSLQPVKVLKEELEKRNLPKSGKKADLIARLEAFEDDQGDTYDAVAEAPPTPAKKAKKSRGKSPDVEIDGILATEVREL